MVTTRATRWSGVAGMLAGALVLALLLISAVPTGSGDRNAGRAFLVAGYASLGLAH